MKESPSWGEVPSFGLFCFVKKESGMNKGSDKKGDNYGYKGGRGGISNLPTVKIKKGK